MTPKPVSTIAKETGIARSSLIRWRDRENIDIQDPAALARRIADKPPRPDSGKSVARQSPDAPQATPDASAESYAEARRRREIANANVAEIEERKMRGELVEVADINRQGDAIGRAVRRELESLAAQLPARIAGRTAAECADILHEETRRILNELSDRSELFNPEPSNQ